MSEGHYTIDQWFARLGLPSDYATRFKLPEVPMASALVSLGEDTYGREQFAIQETADAWQAMQQAALSDDINIALVSAFRSIDYQGRLIEKKLQRGQTLDEILKVSAAPGFSQHHSGRALDLTESHKTALETSFADTQAYAWLLDNAQKFGFIESFGPNNPHGLIWEPWHWYHQPRLI